MNSKQMFNYKLYHVHQNTRLYLEQVIENRLVVRWRCRVLTIPNG